MLVLYVLLVCSGLGSGLLPRLVFTSNRLIFKPINCRKRRFLMASRRLFIREIDLLSIITYASTQIRKSHSNAFLIQ